MLVGCMVIAAVVVLIGAVAAAVAADADALPAAAREAFERGLAAAEQQQWPVAIRYFAEAQAAVTREDGSSFRLGPSASTVFFNLGLAHAKAGHELPAIAWLQAYLAREGRPANAEAIRKEIVRLEVAIEGKIARIIQEAVAAAATAGSVLAVVRSLQAAAGDVEAALRQGAGRIAGEGSASDNAWHAYGTRVAQAALTEQAEAAIRQIGVAKLRDDVRQRLAEALGASKVNGWRLKTRAGSRRARARQFAEQIEDPQRRVKTLETVLTPDPYVFAPRFEPADLALAEQVTSRLGDDVSTRLLAAIVNTKVGRGELEAATDVAERLLRITAKKEKQTGYKVVWGGRELLTLVSARLVRGDGPGAKAIAGRLAPLTTAHTGHLRAKLDAVLGDYEASRRFAATVECRLDGRVGIFDWIIFVQTLSGDLAGANATVAAAAASCSTPGTLTWDNPWYYRQAITRPRPKMSSSRSPRPTRIAVRRATPLAFASEQAAA